MDGRTFRHHQFTRKGDPDAALTDQEIAQKFHALADPVVGRDRALALVGAIGSLDQLADLRTLPLGGSDKASQAAE